MMELKKFLALLQKERKYFAVSEDKKKSLWEAIKKLLKEKKYKEVQKNEL